MTSISDINVLGSLFPSIYILEPLVALFQGKFNIDLTLKNLGWLIYLHDLSSCASISERTTLSNFKAIFGRGPSRQQVCRSSKVYITIDPVLERLEMVPCPQQGVDNGGRHGVSRRLNLEVLVVVDDMRRPGELQEQQP